MSRALGLVLAAIQVALGVVVVWRLWRTGRDAPIRAAPPRAVEPDAIAVVVPVLNEAQRLTASLDGLLTFANEVGEILIVDSGSTDGTCDLVRAYARRDARLRLVEAGRAPVDWNGKVWGLAAGERALASAGDWLLTLDADVHPSAPLARSLVVRARHRHLRLLSVATAQRLSGAVEGLLHPALLATLVYRFGRPGGAAHTPGAALANGQCFLIRRDLLRELGGFQAVRDSLCEDVTLARLTARAGEGVGFYEAEDLIDVAMYSDWRDAWHNWPRSLATRDALFDVSGWLGLLEIVLVQALPLPLLLTGWSSGAPRRLNLLLLAVRLGMLVGMARAYPSRPWTYWLSPMLDVPAAFAVWQSALRARHMWRGRAYTRQKGLLVAV